MIIISKIKHAAIGLKSYASKFGVYAILNTENQKVFIGSGELLKRNATNWCMLNAGKHYNKYLQKEWSMFGASKFRFITLFECKDIEDYVYLPQCERHWISITMATNKKYGYNTYKKPNTHHGFIVKLEEAA